jgi:hypothetical protein
MVVRRRALQMNRRTMLIAGGAALAAVGGSGFVLADLGGMDAYDDSVAASRASLAANPEAADLVRFATLAANSHNTQPWRFRVRDTRIEIIPDQTRRTPVVDPDDHHLFISLGCAAENLAISPAISAEATLSSPISPMPSPSGSRHAPNTTGAPSTPRHWPHCLTRQGCRASMWY